MVSPVFVAGGTGYIGVPLITTLITRGHGVRALARESSRSKLSAGCEIVVGDALKWGGYAEAVVGCASFVHMIGVAHPSPRKAEQFRTIDMQSLKVALDAAQRAGVQHFVYISVAQPAPAMRAYVETRAQCEQMIRAAGLNATFVRPWYVLGPGHRWPYLLKPIYWLMEQLPPTRESALRLGLVTREQMVRALVAAVENPARGVRVVEVPQIREARLAEQLRDIGPPLYRVRIACYGIPPAAGAEAARDIAEGFKKRPWHQNVECDWDGKTLLLTAENDYDPEGLALSDELSDELSANVEPFDGDMKILSVEKI